MDWFKNINNIESCETNFFDYLMINVNTIINLLNAENIDEILDIEKFKIYDLNNNNIFISSNNLYLKSIHDISNNNALNNNALNNNSEINIIKNDLNIHFKNKYKRRYERFINLLLNNDNIMFIYQSNISKEEYLLLESSFKKYTTKKIIIISLCDFGKDINEVIKYYNLYYLNYNNLYKTKEYVYDSTMDFLNWNLIFSKIINIYNENFNE